MVRSNRLLIIFLTWNMLTAEGRVFCQDSFALPWRPLGYSCPVSCSAVISAVNRLQMNDQQRTDVKQRYKNLKMINLFKNGNTMKNRRNLKQNNTWPFDTYTKLLKNEAVVNDLEIELSNAAAILNSTCRKMADGNTIILKSFKPVCTRRSSNFVLHKVTRVFNKYSGHQNTFNEKTIQMLLEKLISHLDLRFGISDMQRLIYYLRKVLRDQKTKIRSNKYITLSSKHCTTIKIPGCFCKRGFVELQGQCVKPSDCSQNPIFKSYLERVILN